jgi:RES domain-containing protein
MRCTGIRQYFYVRRCPPSLRSVPTLYRIVHKRYQDDPFSGKGGLYNKSRWASKGQLVSYASDHLATATLEKLAGVQRADLMSEMVYAKAEIDDALATVLPSDHLPGNWDALPAPDSTRKLGDAWLGEQDFVLLRIPSVVLPESANYVINAGHPEASSLQVLAVAPLLLDNRVLSRIGTAD